MALAIPQLAGPQLYAQIQIFLLPEDEFTTDALEPNRLMKNPVIEASDTL